MNRGAVPVLLAFLVLLVASVPLASAASGAVTISHTPPSSATPGQQIDVVAVLTNATSATVHWNNGTLPAAATVPMTNLSQAQAGGWAYEAWLPAQPDGAMVTYSITATGPGGTATQNYSLAVGAGAPTTMTPDLERSWDLTLAAALSVAVSTIAAIYLFVGLRLKREPE